MADKESKDCAKECAKESLPPLSASDFKIFNGMADHMELFVRHVSSMAQVKRGRDEY